MSLLDLALTDANLLFAWQRVRDNDGAPGADGVTLASFGANLMQRLAALQPYLADQTLLPPIRQWLAAPIVTPDGTKKRTVGVPQGSPLSPLFANLFLDPFDEAVMADPAYWLVRYADDFVVLTKSLDEAEQALEEVHRWMENAGLALNFDKTRIGSFSLGFEFLGVRFEGDAQWAVDPAAAPWVLPRHLRPAADAPPPAPGRIKRQKSAPAGRQSRPPAPPPPAPPVAEDMPAAAGVRLETQAPPLLRTLYVAEPGAYLHRQGERIVVSKGDEELLTLPVEKLDQVHAAGEGAISFGALRWLLRKHVTVVVADVAGEPQGMLLDPGGGQIALRRQQFQKAADADFVLAAARAIVAAKIANGRLLLRRYFRFRPAKDNPHDAALAELQHAVARADSLDAVRGHEGAAARRHFDGLRELLAPQWRIEGRNRQPPRDPVNALFSYGYGILYHTLLSLILRRGLDPHIACLHAEYQGHASLASDLMEEFRPLVVDATVLRLLLSGKVAPADFEYGHADYPVRLSSDLRKRFVAAIEAKLDSPLTHPHTGRTADYRRIMLWQVAHWADVVTGVEAAYRPLALR